VAIFLALGGVGMAAGAVKKNSVKSKSIKDGQVLTQDIGDGAVGAGDLAANAVDGSKVRDDTITGADVNEGSLNIPTSNLDLSGFQQRVNGDCVVGESIRAIAADGTVTCQGAGGPPSGAAGGDLTGTYPNPQIGTGVVGSAEVATDSLAATDLATASVGTAEVGTDALGATDLAVNSVGESEIAPDVVGSSELAPDSVTSGSVVDDAIGSPAIAAGAITSSEMSTNSVFAGAVAPDTLGAADIGANAVGSSELGSIVVERSRVSIDFNETVELVVPCPSGFEAIGGGGGSTIHVTNADIRMIASVPSADNGDSLDDGEAIEAWTTTMINGGGFAETGEAFAVCLD
jgi:hypothetical protein